MTSRSRTEQNESEKEAIFERIFGEQERVERNPQRLMAAGALAILLAACGVIAAVRSALHLNVSHLILVGAISVAVGSGYWANRKRSREMVQSAMALHQLHLATLEALAAAVDAKDQMTHNHVRRVQIYATGVGEVLGLSRREIEALRAGALLHDIGKLAVPDHILNKPESLTIAEFEKMKAHAIIGAKLLESIKFPYPVVPIVRHHHERWDGSGYPDGLRGEEIPLTARILAVAECFDALRENRPYRRGKSRKEACEFLRQHAGSHFDPRVVEVFLHHLPRFESQIAALGLEVSDQQGTKLGDYETPSHLDEIRRAHREVYALYEIARSFGSSLRVEDTAAIIAHKVEQVIPFDTCVVYLYSDEDGYARAVHAVGRNAEKVVGRCVAPGEGVIGFVLSNGLKVMELDPMLDFAGIELEAGEDYRSAIALPLAKGERLFGVLAVYSFESKRYTEDHQRLLDTVARLASDALANAIHHAEAESNALTDALTGLPNRRALQLRFEEEAARTRRTGRPFQLIMLDLDDFKRVNDTFGHKIGDQLLREVARRLQTQLRDYDFLARYAGDEFVALVHDLTASQVEELRARIERTIESFSLHVRDNQRARVGISIGAASYGADGETLDQLIVAADRQMYEVKFARKREAERDQTDGKVVINSLSSASVN